MTHLAHLPWLRSSLAAAGAALALVCASCAGNNGGSTTGDSTTSGGTTATVEPSACANDPRAQVYAVGVESKSQDGSMTIAFMDADPAPPAKGNNMWTVKITNAKGESVDGAKIVTTSYMPDHGHTSPIKPQSVPMGDGVYQVSPVNLFMPGVWEVTLTVAAPGEKDQAVKFTFCIDG